MRGTVYTLNTSSESFTVNFEMLENQTCICRFTQGFKVTADSKRVNCTVEGAYTDIPYEVFILNGDCVGLESSAEIMKETVTVKEYIDKQFNGFKDYFSDGGVIPSPDMLYALANYSLANNINYDYFDFFIDSFARMRVNAYKIDVQSPCSVSYSMSVDVRKNSGFTPAIYKSVQTATGKYVVDYTIELDSALPYVIESSAEIEKKAVKAYTAKNVTEDFYFVFSSSEKPESPYGNSGNETLKIVLYVLSGVTICVAVIYGAFLIIHFKRKK